MVPTVGTTQTQAPIADFSNPAAPPKPCKPWGTGTSLQTEARGVCLPWAGQQEELGLIVNARDNRRLTSCPMAAGSQCPVGSGTGLWDGHLLGTGSGREQEKGAELCNNPVAPGP